MVCALFTRLSLPHFACQFLCPFSASDVTQSSVGVHAADVAAALAIGHWGSDDSICSSFGSGVDALLSRVIPRFFHALGSSCSHHDAAWAARIVRRYNQDTPCSCNYLAMTAPFVLTLSLLYLQRLPHLSSFCFRFVDLHYDCLGIATYWMGASVYSRYHVRSGTFAAFHLSAAATQSAVSYSPTLV